MNDIETRRDIDDIMRRFYEMVFADPIIGFIFTDVAKMDLDEHLPVIGNFWENVVFKASKYKGNALGVHLQLNKQLPLRAGHFTRWLYLFNKAVDHRHQGENAELMKQRAELVAKTITARISGESKSSLELSLATSKKQ